MVEFARHFTTIMRISLGLLLGLIILGNIVLFILSVLQANTPNAGDKFPSSSVEHWAFNIENTTCADFDQRPMRYMYQSQSNQTLRYEYCSWRTNITYWRSVSMVLLLIGAAVLMGILVKRSPANDSAAIWQDPKNVLRVLLAPAGVMGINMFLLMCFDASAVNMSQQWCNDLQVTMESKDPVTCDYTPFVLTVILDFLLFFFWGITILLIFIRQLKRFRPYQQFEDDESDSHEMLDRSNSGWKKKGGKSWIDKHLKKAKERVKGRH